MDQLPTIYTLGDETVSDVPLPRKGCLTYFRNINLRHVSEKLNFASRKSTKKCAKIIMYQLYSQIVCFHLYTVYVHSAFSTKDYSIGREGGGDYSIGREGGGNV